MVEGRREFSGFFEILTTPEWEPVSIVNFSVHGIIG